MTNFLHVKAPCSAQFVISIIESKVLLLLLLIFYIKGRTLKLEAK